MRVRKPTPIPFDVLRWAIIDAYRWAVVMLPPRAAVRYAFAIMCHEHTGITGRVSSIVNVTCNNLGNIDATPEQIASGDYFETVPEREILAGQETKRVHLRGAHDTPELGARAWWLRMRSRWPEAFNLLAGDPAVRAGDEHLDEVHRLAYLMARPTEGRGYYTDNPDRYAAALPLWLVVFDQRWPGDEQS